MSSTLRVVSLTIPGTTRPDEPCFGPLDTPFRKVTNLVVTLRDRLVCVTHLLRAHDQAFHIQGLSYETFRPIVTLVHLRELVINLNNPIAIDDDEFARLVCNWPCLEVLRLTGRRQEHPAKSLSLKCLLSLLVSCRKLRSISITLDARQVPLMDTGVESDVCSRLVSYLSFQNSPIEHSELVAEFLFKHMPYVTHMHSVFTQRLSVEDQMYPYLQFKLWARVDMQRKTRFGSGGK